MTLEEQRDILLAAIAGREIEWKPKKSHTWDYIQPITSIFNFQGNDYRIKPQPEPTCFNQPWSRLRGRWVRDKIHKDCWAIIGYDKNHIFVGELDDGQTVKEMEHRYELLPEDTND